MIRVDRLIAAALADVVRKAPLCPEKVDFAWQSAVGPALQRVTTVRLDDHGVLHVSAANAHWEREVKRSSRLIIARLETLLGAGTVKRIKV